MFGHRYFGRKYYGPRYFGDGGSAVNGGYWGRYFGGHYFGHRYFPPATDTPISNIVNGGYWGRYYAGVYFGKRYFPPATDTVPITPEPSPEPSGPFGMVPEPIRFRIRPERLVEDDEEIIAFLLACLQSKILH